MKRIFVLFALLYSCNIHAQISFLSDDYAQIDDSYHVSQANTGLLDFDFAATGTDFSWDFSTMPFESQDDITFVDPANAGYQFTWCLANGVIIGCASAFEDLTNLAQPQINELDLGPVALSNIINHQKITNTTLENRLLGISVDLGGFPLPVPIDYEEVDTLYQFPLEFGNQDSSYGRLVLDLSDVGVDITFVQDSKRVNEIEGWGSLQTPYGEFPNTLKVRTRVEQTDTITTMGTSIPTTTTRVEYRWFSKDYGIPVLEAVGLEVAGEVIINQVTYIDSVRCIDPTAFFLFTPFFPTFDAASQSSEVNFNNLSTNASTFMWDFGDGSTSTEENPSHTFSCPGLQDVQLIVVNDVCDEYTADTVSIPVFINDTTGFSDPTLVDAYLCGGDSIFVGGAWQTEPGVYTDEFIGETGCDSTVITTLDIGSVTSGELNYQGCVGDGTSFNINGTTYDESNPTGMELLVNSEGCDSVLTIDLQFTALDLGVSVDESTVSVNQDNASYQWVDCNDDFNPIDGATSQSYTAPFFGGDFAVEVSLNGCTQLSDCIEVMPTSTSELTLQDTDFQIIPNPFNQEFWLQSDYGTKINDIRLLNSIGQELQIFQFIAGSVIELRPVDIPGGLYLLKIVLEDQQVILKKIIKK